MSEPTNSERVPPNADATGDDVEPAPPNKRKAIFAILTAVVVGFIVFGVIFPQLVDWGDVAEVLRNVDPIDLVVIFGLGAIRYFPAGKIYSIVLPGLSFKRGTQSWVATTGVSSTLPGFDLVLRVAMYRGWGFSIERTMSAMFMSGIVEMSTKLLLATMAVLIWGLVTLDLGALGIAAVATLVLVVLAALVRAVLRSEDTARRFGEQIERATHWGMSKLKRQAPDDLVDRVLDVRLEARDVLGNRWQQAFLFAFIGQAFVFTILLLSIRAVGIDSSVLGWSDILLGYAITTIVTSIPITPGSVGIAELVLVGCFTAIAGREVGPLATAGVLLYRLSVWLLPIIIGWIVTMRWQATSGLKLFGGGKASAQ